MDFERIKRLVIIAMFSDDGLMNKLVLKGGNLLDVVFGISSRASMDLDFSIEDDFETLQLLQEKVSRALTTTFGEEGYIVFDINIRDVPPVLSPNMADFWGGYKIDFKIINKKEYDNLKGEMRSLRMGAHRIGEGGSPKFKIDISKHEYCAEKRSKLLDGYTIYTYSPEMVVGEKIRAVCQQMPDYVAIVRSHPSARARDFLDIHAVIEHFGINLDAESFRNILRGMFAVKRVPLVLIGKIADFREYHRPDFVAVQATVKPGLPLRDFDFYFDYLIEKCRSLESLWNV